MEHEPSSGQSYQRFSMHWNSPEGDRYLVEFFKGPTYDTNIDKLRNRAWNIHQQGLKYDPLRTMRELVSNMQANRGGSIYFASTVGPDAKDVGYITQRVMNIAIRDDDSAEEGDLIGEDDLTEEGNEPIRALVVSTKVFLPCHQQKGLGTFFTEQANLMHRPEIFVGRTQNPYVILALKRTGLFEKIHPFDELYGESTEQLNGRQKVLNAIAKKARYSNVDLRNGLCVGVYPPGEERAFVLDENNKEAVEVYRIMTEDIGMDPVNGDAIIYTAMKWGRARYIEEVGGA